MKFHISLLTVALLISNNYLQAEPSQGGAKLQLAQLMKDNPGALRELVSEANDSAKNPATAFDLFKSGTVGFTTGIMHAPHIPTLVSLPLANLAERKGRELAIDTMAKDSNISEQGRLSMQNVAYWSSWVPAGAMGAFLLYMLQGIARFGFDGFMAQLKK